MKIKFISYFLIIATIGSILSCKTMSTDRSKVVKSFNNLAWISGTWKYTGTDYSIIERWAKVSDTLYKGVNFLILEKDTTMSEVIDLRLRNGEIFYNVAFESAGKLNKSSYKMIKTNSKEFVFENKELVDQSKITYKKEKSKHKGIHVVQIILEGNDGKKNTKVNYYLMKVDQ
jgi:hypothetical protein